MTTEEQKAKQEVFVSAMNANFRKLRVKLGDLAAELADTINELEEFAIESGFESTPTKPLWLHLPM